MMMRSASAPRRSLSSRETPGRVATLIVNEPSLNDGRNDRPSEKNTTMAPAKATPVAMSTGRVWASVQASERE